MEINITYKKLSPNGEPKLDESFASFLNYSAEALGNTRLYNYLRINDKFFVISDTSLFLIYKKQKDVDILLKGINTAIKLLSDSNIKNIKYNGIIEEIDNSSNDGMVRLKTKDATIVVKSRSLY